MRLIDADRLKETLRQGAYSSVMKVIDREPTIDILTPSENAARFITKAIASHLSEMQLDLPSTIYEDIECLLMKGKFIEVEAFLKYYIENNCGEKMGGVSDSESI